MNPTEKREEQHNQVLSDLRKLGVKSPTLPPHGPDVMWVVCFAPYEVTWNVAFLNEREQWVHQEPDNPIIALTLVPVVKVGDYAIIRQLLRDSHSDASWCRKTLRRIGLMIGGDTFNGDAEPALHLVEDAVADLIVRYRQAVLGGGKMEVHHDSDREAR